MPSAKRSYRRECSPRPCTTANVTSAPALGHARYESLVPSAESIVPSRARVPSAGKVAEASEDLERLLFGVQQRRSGGPDAEVGVGPLPARGPVAVKAEGWSIEE